MKIVITSSGDTLDSLVDSQFGRCIYFVIYDTETRAIEFIPNPNKDAEEGTGTASVELVSSRSVTKIVSGGFGMRVKPLLDRLNIQMIVMKEPMKTIQEIITLLNH